MRSRHRKHFDVRQEVIKTNPPVRRKGILLDPPPPSFPRLNRPADDLTVLPRRQ